MPNFKPVLINEGHKCQLEIENADLVNVEHGSVAGNTNTASESWRDTVPVRKIGISLPVVAIEEETGSKTK